jgi:hypothetical protein
LKEGTEEEAGQARGEPLLLLVSSNAFRFGSGFTIFFGLALLLENAAVLKQQKVGIVVDADGLASAAGAWRRRREL